MLKQKSVEVRREPNVQSFSPSISDVEKAFLCKSFDKALLGCYILLWKLTSQSSHEQVVNSKLGGSLLTSENAPIHYDPNNRLMLSFLPPRPHICSHQDCMCSRLLVLMGQTLFELNRADEFFPLILRVFPSSDVPFSVVRVTLELLRCLEKYHEASDFAYTALDGAGYSHDEKSFVFRFLCLHVLPGLHDLSFSIKVAEKGHASISSEVQNALIEQLKRKLTDDKKPPTVVTSELIEVAVDEDKIPVVVKKEGNIISRNGLTVPILVVLPLSALLIFLWKSKRTRDFLTRWIFGPLKDFFTLSFSR